MSGPADDEAKRRALADTLPGSRLEPPRSSDRDVVTSAPVASVATSMHANGSVTLSGERLTEALARELIGRRMAAAGLSLEADVTFHDGDTLITLDGYDAERGIGYQFVSHADVDVVTDFDDTAAAGLAELSRLGRTHVLVVHDHEAPSADELLELVDDFLRQRGLAP